jgi:hypothetical protein
LSRRAVGRVCFLSQGRRTSLHGTDGLYLELIRHVPAASHTLFTIWMSRKLTALPTTASTGFSFLDRKCHSNHSSPALWDLRKLGPSGDDASWLVCPLCKERLARGVSSSEDATRKPDSAAALGVNIQDPRPKRPWIHASLAGGRNADSKPGSVPLFQSYYGALNPLRGPQITLCGAGIGGLLPLKTSRGPPTFQGSWLSDQCNHFHWLILERSRRSCSRRRRKGQTTCSFSLAFGSAARFLPNWTRRKSHKAKVPRRRIFWDPASLFHAPNLHGATPKPSCDCARCPGANTHRHQPRPRYLLAVLLLDCGRCRPLAFIQPTVYTSWFTVSCSAKPKEKKSIKAGPTQASVHLGTGECCAIPAMGLGASNDIR